MRMDLTSKVLTVMLTAFVLTTLPGLPTAAADHWADTDTDASGPSNNTCFQASPWPWDNEWHWGLLDLPNGDPKDFYYRWFDAGDTIWVAMDPWDGDFDINVVLYYPDSGCVIADFNYESAGNREDIVFTATESGFWVVEAWIQYGGGPYDLLIHRTTPYVCVPTSADPSTVNELNVLQRTFYVEERGSPLGPAPGSGLLFGEGTYVYEESNGLPGLQRGGIGLLGDQFPPGGPTLLYDEDPINDEHCGHGPDMIITGPHP